MPSVVVGMIRPVWIMTKQADMSLVGREPERRDFIFQLFCARGFAGAG